MTKEYTKALGLFNRSETCYVFGLHTGTYVRISKKEAKILLHERDKDLITKGQDRNVRLEGGDLIIDI